MQKQRNTHAAGAAAVLAAALFIAATGSRAAAQEPSAGMVEWPYVGADQGASKYSPLADIDASNVERLGVAWTWEPNELPNQAFRTRPGSFEVMPLMIDDVVYVSTMYTRVVALDAETGDELWAFDPEAWRTGPGGRSSRRLQAPRRRRVAGQREPDRPARARTCGSSSTAATASTR